VRVVQGGPCTVMEQGVCCAGKHRAQCSLVVYYCLEAPCGVKVGSACSARSTVHSDGTGCVLCR
jgi:hypothetical protein